MEPRKSRQRSFIIPLINTIVGIVEAIIGIRIILKLFGANPNAPFVQWLYATSGPLLAPFQGIFPSPELDGRFVIEFSALFALIIYSIIGSLLIKVVHLIRGD
ncbi:YggT family protein [Pseudalkalibacillus caeni]|uniref:YggT family protein n=1 Tax=Exobacillus caeni TaxID=2574798 RepID=A0A5R9F9H2_9BACL|nr:YggT family protein [Pseudalkalibacillus caeni]TLS38890.1 YggT family protein [Pseudalkalibacillus caeni]